MILCSGAFDGLHSGHVAYLDAAKRLYPDDPLVVAIAPDHYIRTQKHRAARWSQSQRARVVASLRSVDRVVEHAEVSVAQTIRLLKPRAFIKGMDWLHTIPRDVAAACVEAGAVLEFTDTDEMHCQGVDWGAIGRAL